MDNRKDTVILYGGGQITYWQFPAKFTWCPIRNTHATYYMFCSACNYIVYARGSKELEKHEAKCHSNCSAKKTTETQIVRNFVC